MSGFSKYLRICIALAAAILLFLPEIANACPRCFGAQVDSPITHGISMAMLSLIGMTGTVMGGIVLFFIQMMRRVRKLSSGKYVTSDRGELLKLPERLFEKVENE